MLISPDNHLALMALIFGVVGISLWMQRYAWARLMSVALLVVVVPLILSNAGLIPRDAPAYRFASNYFVMVAIPLLLFKADLKQIFTETGRTLLAFLIAAVGTLVGVAVAFFVISHGEWGAQLGAVLTGGFVGGSMNFVAVAKAVELDDPTHLATALGAVVSTGLLYLLFLAVVPAMGWFKHWDAKGHTVTTASVVVDPADTGDTGGPSITDMALGLGLSLAICAAGSWIAGLIGYPNYNILVITVLAVAVANLAPQRMAQLKGETDVGMLLMYAFFTSFGASADLVSMLRDAPLWFAFAACVVVMHFVIAFGVGRLLGFSAREVATASNACLLGPAPAAALAAQQDWDEMVTPGILCGVFGYVIGNFLGVFMYALLT